MLVGGLGGDPADPYADIEISRVDLNDFAIMRDISDYRAALLLRGTPPQRLNYSYFEDERLGSSNWPNTSEFILLHPTAESGLYSVYRQARHYAEDPEAEITPFEANFLVALYASAQHLALLEDRRDIYQALVDAQTCLVPALMEKTWSVVVSDCQPALRVAVYDLLKIDPTYRVENGSSWLLQ